MLVLQRGCCDHDKGHRFGVLDVEEETSVRTRHHCAIPNRDRDAPNAITVLIDDPALDDVFRESHVIAAICSLYSVIPHSAQIPAPLHFAEGVNGGIQVALSAMRSAESDREGPCLKD